MAHLSVRSGYRDLAQRINRFPQGAPPTKLLFSILQMLFSEREAELVSALPIRPVTAAQAARLWKTTPQQAAKALEDMAGRAVLLDLEDREGNRTYVLPPPMAGFFEFAMMRVRGDIDQKLLAELFFEYLNVEEEFIRALFLQGDTQLGRVFVNEEVLTPELSLQVLDYERASEVIRGARHRAVGMCYCRHKMQHLGRACDAPMNICMTFDNVAASLVRHGVARRMEAAEGLDLLGQAREQGLVQFGENVRESVNFICHCCGCCCEAMIAARRFGLLHPVHTTSFLPEVADPPLCNGCGKCVQSCPVESMALVSANDPRYPKKKKALLDAGTCLGCGLCVQACPRGAVRLEPRPSRVITPLNSTHRAVLMAIERGTLQNLIFDNHALASHRAMAAILGVILKLPPLKQALASRQLQSRYLERLVSALS